MNMKTVDEIERGRQGTVWGSLVLFMLFLMGGIFMGATSLYVWALEQTKGSSEYLLYTLLVSGVVACLLPGIWVWLLLRKKNRLAALYGLMVASVISVAVPIFLGVPFASHP